MKTSMACILILCFTSQVIGQESKNPASIYGASSELLSSARAPRSRYSVTNVAQELGPSRAVAINAKGQMAGTAGRHAYFFDGNTARLFLFNAAAESEATAMNNHGDIVGSGRAPSIGPFLPFRAFVYLNGVPRFLGILAGVDGNSGAIGVNDRREVVGSSHFFGFHHAFIYTEEDGMRDLGIPGQLNFAQAINNSGEVVGFYMPTILSLPRAFLRLANGEVRDLGTLGDGGAQAIAISNQGWVVGQSQVGKTGHAFLYRDGQMFDLDGRPGRNSAALGINSKGQVVGYFIDAAGEQSAFLYSDGSMYDLNDLIPRDADRFLSSADGINDAGQIAASGTYQGQPASFLLSPTPTTTYYYGIGDSVASGHGLDDDGGPCRQSRFAYPRLVAELLATAGVVDRGSSLFRDGEILYLGCSGASTENPNPTTPDCLLRYQADSVSLDFRALKRERPAELLRAVVSITAGANDFPWIDPQRAPSFFCQDRATFESETNTIARSVHLNLSQVVHQLQAEGNVSVVLTTYHNPFNRTSHLFLAYKFFGGCLLTSDSEMYDRSEYLVHTLNTEIRRVVTQGGLRDVAFADVHDGPDGFHEHESPRGTPGLGSCGTSTPEFTDSWIQAPLYATDPVTAIFEGLVLGKGDCIHPNPKGAKVYAAHVESAVRALLAL